MISQLGALARIPRDPELYQRQGQQRKRTNGTVSSLKLLAVPSLVHFKGHHLRMGEQPLINSIVIAYLDGFFFVFLFLIFILLIAFKCNICS